MSAGKNKDLHSSKRAPFFKAHPRPITKHIKRFHLSTLHTLASGSAGNALLISQGDTHILVDAGISCRRIATALATLNLTPGDLAGILITHSHSDHVSGLKTLSKKHGIPIWCSPETGAELAGKVPETAPYLRLFPIHTPFSMGDCQVQAFPIPHDAVGAVGFRINDVGILTDCGYLTQESADVLFGVSTLVLEANHDVELVQTGPYPYHLKQRVLGDWGHLSNDAAASFAVAAAHNGTTTIVLAHLSAENNTPQMALRTVEQALCLAELSPLVVVAPRDTLSQPFPVLEAVCKK